MMLLDALETLAGPAFHLVQDPVHRLVTFERCMEQQIAVRDIGPNIELEVVQDGD
jgi:type IV pili sensor histidine kinase/response regulator